MKDRVGFPLDNTKRSSSHACPSSPAQTPRHPIAAAWEVERVRLHGAVRMESRKMRTGQTLFFSRQLIVSWFETSVPTKTIPRRMGRRKE